MFKLLFSKFSIKLSWAYIPYIEKKVFTSANKLVFIQEKKFLCISCEKPYMNLYQLREHIQKGLCKDESRTCKLCNKVFIDKHRLVRHMKIHNNVREFKCPHCDKSFIQKRTLKEHILTHNSTRQFECKVCLKKFVQQNHLKVNLIFV